MFQHRPSPEPINQEEPKEPEESKGKRQLTDEHRAALKAGKTRSRAVRLYLEALKSQPPKYGRRSPETLRKRVKAIDNDLATATPLQSLHLTQERINLLHKLEAAETIQDLVGLEDEFVKVAKEYGTDNKISYRAWRVVGVPAATLKRAGISRAAS